MKLIYIRCNQEHVCRKKEKEIKNLEKNNEVIIITKKVTSGKKILKKEIKELKDIISNYQVNKLEIVYIDEKYIDKLKDELGIEVGEYEQSHNSATKTVPEQLKIMFELIKFLNKSFISFQKNKNCKTNDFVSKRDLVYIFGGKNISKQTALTYMHRLEELFSPLIYSERKKDGLVFKLREGDNILREIFEKIESLEKIHNLLSSLSEEDIKLLSEETQKFIRNDKDLIIFKTHPFEELSAYDNEIYKKIKQAIKEKRYIDVLGYEKKINVDGYEREDYFDVIPLKFIFMENNWYFAGVVNDEKKGKFVRFFRISFIDDINIKGKVSKSEFKEEYYKFIEEFETPFTHFGKKWKKAKLKIDSSIVMYFDRKKHFPKQKRVRIDENNNMIIEVGYTNEMDLLPMIKKWLPLIEVIESEDGSIEKSLERDLQIALKKLKK